MSECTDHALRVLIADDETLIRLDLRSLLESAGMTVVAEARDGQEAIELAASSTPDAIVMDVKMPRCDGIDAAQQITATRPVPIVMVTAYGEADLARRAAEAGAFGYLVKPFRAEDLLPALATARVRHAELQALREEARTLAEALESRKTIERAKGLLMAHHGINENDAYGRIRRASQKTGKPMLTIAQALIATLEGDA